MGQTIVFADFLQAVSAEDLPFVENMHQFLMEQGCAVKLQEAKSGYVVSYTYENRVLMNYVFRKKGMFARIYADAVNGYEGFLETLPEPMIKSIEKAPVCRRLVDPAKCNARCSMGYVFPLRGESYQKCKYNCFLFLLDETSRPFASQFLEKELEMRANAG